MPVDDELAAIQALRRLAERYRWIAQRQSNQVLRAGFEDLARDCERRADALANALDERSSDAI